MSLVVFGTPMDFESGLSGTSVPKYIEHVSCRGTGWIQDSGVKNSSDSVVTLVAFFKSLLYRRVV